VLGTFLHAHFSLDSQTDVFSIQRVKCLVHFAVVALFFALNASAQNPAGAPPLTAPTNDVVPTITAAMGDLGGKFFGQAPDPAKTRRYFIAAEPEMWDYVPQGADVVCGKPLPPPLLAQRRGGKVRYVQYTDATFTAKVIQKPNLGIMGPVLRGTVGEFIAVTFFNRTTQPLSMHPHGVKYDKDSEGALYQPRPGLGAAVGPSAKFTYVWHLDEGSGPLPAEPSSKGWLYHSHVNGDEEAGMGLVGFIIVTDAKRARPDGTPNDIDRELAALFMTFDESGLGAAEKEAAEYGNLGGGGPPPKPWAQVQELLEAGARPGINGYLFGNLPGLEANEGERVRWYVFGLGGEDDFHTAHWHGLRVVEDGRRRTDNIELMPATMKVADMMADNPGTWLFHCHVAEHMTEGMFANFTVHPKTATTGAGRAPHQAFFGLPQGAESLQIRRVEIIPGPERALRITGSVSVFQAFSVFTQTIRVELGGRTATFKPDRAGAASGDGITWRTLNANRYGVIYGGLMEFQLTLTGADWLRAAGFATDGPPSTAAPAALTLHVGNARHTATLRAPAAR
jgi:manganese oxidase